MAHSSQGSHTGQLYFANDWQMPVRRDDWISITLYHVNADFLNQIRNFWNKLSSRGWVDPVPALSHIYICGSAEIEPAISWSVSRLIDP